MLGPSTSLELTQIHFFSWLSNIPRESIILFCGLTVPHLCSNNLGSATSAPELAEGTVSQGAWLFCPLQRWTTLFSSLPSSTFCLATLPFLTFLPHCQFPLSPWIGLVTPAPGPLLPFASSEVCSLFPGAGRDASQLLLLWALAFRTGSKMPWF